MRTALFSSICALALVLHGSGPMTTALAGPMPSTLEVGLGLASRCSGPEAIARAASIAASRLHGAAPDLALVVTAGSPVPDAGQHARGVLGQIQIAGGATAAILTDDGPMKEGALVACVANADAPRAGLRPPRDATSPIPVKRPPGRSCRACRFAPGIRAVSASPSAVPRPGASPRRFL